MDPAGWQRAKPIIEEALQLPPEARRAYVTSVCDDAALRDEIVAALESYDLEERTAQAPITLDSRVTASPRARDSSTGFAESTSKFIYEPGRQVGDRYILVAPLGKGGGGEVHRARDQRLQREVAIKILPPRGDAEDSRRIREARAAAQLNHRGIATIHDVFDLDGRACIVMELVDGDTLAQRMRQTTFTLPDIVNVGAQIADAVEHAHACGILHCDLKPANVKFAADGTLKVLDFGLARRTEHSAAAVRGVTGLTAGSLDGLALGTPGYMSPEQLLGLPIDFRSDVYGIGVIIYEMASGVRLFDGGSVMSTAVAVLSAKVPELPRRVPRRLRNVVYRALNRKPEDRYPSAAELRDALTAVRQPMWRNLLRLTFV
jgi:serine/threonine protein kinase